MELIWGHSRWAQVLCPQGDDGSAHSAGEVLKHPTTLKLDAARSPNSDLIEALKNPARVALLQLIDTLTALPNTDVMLGHAR